MAAKLEDNTDYLFTPTQDWFSHNVDSWNKLFPLVQANQPRVLEIGSWEGRSAVFLLTTLCKDGGEIICIDHFDLFETDAGKERFRRINHNLEMAGGNFRIVSEFSVPALSSILKEETMNDDAGFDWIYVDGSHRADDTFLDGELAWRLAKKGTIFIFDDYHWSAQPEDSIHHPKRGIDTFLILHAGEYERLTSTEDYQVVLQKKTDMRIGFRWSETPLEPSRRKTDVLEYGLNVALTIDSAYVVGAAVVIRSAIESAYAERITFYVIDCGLDPTEKAKLKACAEDNTQITFEFVQLSPTCMTSTHGPTWAKIDMIESLPVERVIYLDADVLVRRGLKELWDTDLQGKDVGAVVDIGYPMGHNDATRGPYFNAGVLLMDLARIRMTMAGLQELELEMKDSKHHDQDALNLHFKDRWMALDLKWNAQGLGTYARYPSKDREGLRLEKMDDPNIVHFTGPVSPSMVEVLNPYVQPPTSKPWGYLGSPGHPYFCEWWETLERTPWRGLRSTEMWKVKGDQDLKRAIEEGSTMFLDTVSKMKVV
ncbi:hypothetical protein D9613_010287 [Agrocybe pediades]|uniref:Glycosyltransferase family 8 protein n=1 Tax=Agrocybe pediades TaxID=84607 RepID=A0A8H4VI61_9AGAR|nr:hypothetical protein D9613_010287 [Agrocybe pediades]